MKSKPQLKTMYADLHIHIGRTEAGDPVKISGSRNLTFYNIAREASERKGIHITGIIDCHSPAVQAEIEHYLEKGTMTELPGGGIRYKGTTVLLGSEIEVKDPGFGPCHLLIFLPTFSAMKEFTAWLSPRMKNVNLSSQRVYAAARELQEQALGRGGMLIPAHIFTPHKGLYGSGCDRLADLLDPKGVAAVELGLSSNTQMADRIPELHRFSYVTNSDAHSLGKIAREYNELKVCEPTFEEVAKALHGSEGRHIAANYGFAPQLGKYHSTRCASCGTLLPAGAGAAVRTCPACGESRLTRGVSDRIAALAALAPNGRQEGDSLKPVRPPYREQVPLEFVPGLGPRKREELLRRFGTEMNVLHHVPEEELAAVAGSGPAAVICAARAGKVNIVPGGGGTYGKIR